jgi:rhodanese-related sulfurtransferase
MSKRLKVLNVLSPEYYLDAHIKGSINVTIAELKDFAEHTSKDSLVIVYCANHNCDLAARAWHILHELGFDNVFAYEGGMQEWYTSGYPVEGPCSLSYLHMPLSNVSTDERSVQSITKENLKARMEREGLL